MTTPTARPLTVVVADGNDVSRAGLKARLADDPRFAVVGETADGVMPLAARLRPDVVVLDPDIGGCLSLPSITALVATALTTRLCIRTAVFEPCSFLQALKAGAHAYVLKSQASSAFLMDALVLVGRFGATLIDPAIGQHFREHHLLDKLRLALPGPSTPQLTHRQLEVLALVAEGNSAQEIAAQLGVGLPTVATHVSRLANKLGATNRAHLVTVAFRQGLLDG